jgi:hypothetical protein
MTVSAHGIGAPTQGALTLTAVNVGGGRVDITAVGTAAPGGDGARVRYGIVRLDGPVGQDGAPVSADSCRTSDDGGQRVFRGRRTGACTPSPSARSRGSIHAPSVGPP